MLCSNLVKIFIIIIEFFSSNLHIPLLLYYKLFKESLFDYLKGLVSLTYENPEWHWIKFAFQLVALSFENYCI